LPPKKRKKAREEKKGKERGKDGKTEKNLGPQLKPGCILSLRL
jgi:hypothetical protein